MFLAYSHDSTHTLDNASIYATMQLCTILVQNYTNYAMMQAIMIA